MWKLYMMPGSRSSDLVWIRIRPDSELLDPVRIRIRPEPKCLDPVWIWIRPDQKCQDLVWIWIWPDLKIVDPVHPYLVFNSNGRMTSTCKWNTNRLKNITNCALKPRLTSGLKNNRAINAVEEINHKILILIIICTFVCMHGKIMRTLLIHGQ